MSKQLIINNPTLISFYDENKNISFEDINKLIVNILTNIIDTYKRVNNTDEPIPTEQLYNILNEYFAFIIKKSRALDTLQTLNKTLTEQLNDIQLPVIEKLLTEKGKL